MDVLSSVFTVLSTIDLINVTYIDSDMLITEVRSYNVSGGFTVTLELHLLDDSFYKHPVLISNGNY